MRLRSLLSLFSHDLAIDLGTANTLVFIADGGVVVDEPSMVGINNVTGKVEAIGVDAKRMLGRTPGSITAVRPMRDGVIADFKIAERMLTYFISKAHNRNLFVHPRIVIGVPGGITLVERRAVVDAAMRARASGGAFGRAGDDGGDWCRTAGVRTGRQHGGRHWRRHH